MANRTTVQSVASDLRSHEAKCEERWKSICKEKAEFMLWRELEDEYEHYINALVTVPMNQCQFDALVSWVYNLGPANLKVSTLLKKLNAGDYENVPSQIKRWNKATVNGERKVLPGLTRRREAEALMFEGKPWEHI